MPRLYELRFNILDCVLLLALAFVTAVIFGALSQLLISETVLARGLNSQERTATNDRSTSRFRFVFITAQVAASAVLLVAAGLLLKSLRNVMDEKPGFDAQHLLTIDVPFSPRNTDNPKKVLAHTRELIDAFDALPAVVSVSVVNRLPLTGDSEIHDVRAVGKPLPRQADRISAEYRVIDAAYFRTMQIPLIAGRQFRPDDPAAFAVINQRMAAGLWPGEDPVGKRFSDGDNPPLTVIGIVGNVHYASLEKPEMMQFYRLITANPDWAHTFVIRSASDPNSLTPQIQRMIWHLDASEPVAHIQTMEHLLESVTLERRFETELLSSFAAMALFLSGLGLFGVASLSVARRTREFGIRLALGASGSEILRAELARTATIVIIGLGGGLFASILVARAMAGLLYGVTPWSWQAFVSAALVLIVAALLAAWLPARRAARIDPASALRIE